MEDRLNKIKSWFASYLISKGYKLVEEKNHPEAFGSWYTLYKKNSRLIRLVWDGKDYEVRIEESEVNAPIPVSWKNLTSYIIEADTSNPSIEEIEVILEKSIL